jgi:ubiquinone/menaquinone biosynthesis C-methylase UbiE
MARKFNPDNWKRLLSDDRHALLPPGEFLDRVGVRPGSVAADLGAGPGFFTLPLAERVGPEGRVHAIDVSPEMVRLLQERGLPPWVDARLGGERGIPLPDAEVDVALLAFVLHEIDAPGEYLAEVARVLRPGGRLVVLEWVAREEDRGPPAAERLPAEETDRILAAAGFTVVERGDANPSNYYRVATPPGDGAAHGTASDVPSELGRGPGADAA